MTDKPEDLAALRAEIDAIDIDLQNLLQRRAEVVRRVGRSKGVTGAIPLQPAREAAIMRRLVERHDGVFPKKVMIRMWREMLSATVGLQGPFSVAVFAPEDRPGAWDHARDYFGSFTPMVPYRSTGDVVKAVSDGAQSVGILPMPDEEEAWPWWRLLLGDARRTAKVFARLPFGGQSNGRSETEAFAIAKLPLVATGDDRTMIAVETSERISRSGLNSALSDVGLKGSILGMWRADSDPESWLKLIDVSGFLDSDSPDLDAFKGKLGQYVGNIYKIGSYATPLSSEQLAMPQPPGEEE
ncbi:MAG: chorismate mutase [Rhodospirillales bacterium]